MHSSSSLGDGKIVNIIREIYKESNMFESIEYYHVLRELNQQAYQLANMASQLEGRFIRTKIWASTPPTP
jgi:hypothetical protein